jgi:hypothetical protein
LCSKGDPGNPHKEFVAPVLKQECIAMSFIINVLVTDPFEVILVVSQLSNIAPFYGGHSSIQVWKDIYFGNE